MKIQKFEQSGFIIESDSGYRIAFDIGNKTNTEKLEGVLVVDLFIVSHIHGDHFYPENIAKLNPSKILLPQQCHDALESLISEYVITSAGFIFKNDNIKISFFDVDHGPNANQPLENTGFLIEVDGQKIYFAGDMYYSSGMSVADLEVDYALLPVGSHYTFGPQEALNFAKTFKKIGKIISMHYEKNNFIDPVRHKEFIELVKNDFIVE